MAKEIQMLGDTKSAMNDLVASTKDQNRKLDLLIEAISNNTGFVANSSVTRTETKKDLISTIIKWGSLVCILLIIVGFGMYAFTFIRDFNSVDNNNNTTQSVVVSNTELPSNVVDTPSVTDTLVLESTN